MLKTIRTNSGNPDFIQLVLHLDADLAVRDGEDHSFYAQFNKIARIKFVVVAYDDKKPVGCGAIKKHASESMEVKRMYVAPEHRGKGVATRVLSELEKWAAELGCEKCVLETGKKQPEAIGLYKKSGYKKIRNYGQYAGIENSLCFEKQLTKKASVKPGAAKAKKNPPNPVDRYIAGFPRETQKLLHQLRATIIKAAPEAEEVISYKMPAYKYHGVLAYFSGFKNHIGFYPTALAIEKFKKELSAFKGARGSVQFPLDRPLPIQIISKIITFRAKTNLKKAGTTSKEKTKI